MAMVSLRPSSKGVLFLAITAVMIFFGCVLVYMAGAAKLRDIHADLAAKNKEIEDSRKIAQTLEVTRLKCDDIKSQIDCLEVSVSTQDYIPTLLRQIEALGKSVNLKVLSVRPAPAPAVPAVRKMSSGAQAAEGNVEAASQQQAGPDGQAAKPVVKPYDELAIDVELEGSFASTLDMLYRLTSFQKIISVNNVQLSPVAASGPQTSPKLSIKINVTAFVLKDNMPTQNNAATSCNPSERRAGNEAG